MLDKIGKVFIVCQIRYSLLLNILLEKKTLKRKKWDTILRGKKYRWEETPSTEHAEINPIIPWAGSKGIMQHKNGYVKNNGVHHLNSWYPENGNIYKAEKYSGII